MYESAIQSTNEAQSFATGSAQASTPRFAHAGIYASGLSKRYGELWALREVDLEVPAGTVLGLLGHNGAGKTTAIRILTTLTAPTAGAAQVAGHDVLASPGLVRASIGVAGQGATVDGLLSGRANLEMIGRLHHLPARAARERADELLERLRLSDASERLVKTYSGGMRRRLDLAATLVSDPPVIFLDEPTTGLDPLARRQLWDLLRELVARGRTLLLTTQYLEEADELADDVVVLNHGRVVAHGSPAELKSRLAGERFQISVRDVAQLDAAAAALQGLLSGPAERAPEELKLTVSVQAGTTLMGIARALESAHVEAIDVHRREATLDDVFMSLIGDPPPPGRPGPAPPADGTVAPDPEEVAR